MSCLINLSNPVPLRYMKGQCQHMQQFFKSTSSRLVSNQLLKLEIVKGAQRDSLCSYLITFIHKYKEEIKSGHDRSWQIYILFQWFWSVIVSTDGVCCCQNGCPGIQSSLTTKGKNHDRFKDNWNGIWQTSTSFIINKNQNNKISSFTY